MYDDLKLQFNMKVNMTRVFIKKIKGECIKEDEERMYLKTLVLWIKDHIKKKKFLYSVVLFYNIQIYT